MEENYKFSREWSKEKEEENKRLQKEYIDQYKATENEMFGDIVQETQRKESSAGEIHMVNKPDIVEQQEALAENKQPKRNHISKKRMIIIGTFLLLGFIVLVGYTRSKDREVKEVENSGTVNKNDVEAVDSVVNSYMNGKINGDLNLVYKSITSEYYSELVNNASTMGMEIDEYLSEDYNMTTYELVDTIYTPFTTELNGFTTDGYRVRCKQIWDDDSVTFRKFELRKETEGEWRITNSWEEY